MGLAYYRFCWDVLGLQPESLTTSVLRRHAESGGAQPSCGWDYSFSQSVYQAMHAFGLDLMGKVSSDCYLSLTLEHLGIQLY